MQFVVKRFHIFGSFEGAGGVVPQSIWKGPTSGITHRWQMDAASIVAGTVKDLVGSLDATIVGAPARAPSPAGAFVPTGLSFDGVNDALTLASNPISMTGAWSIGFWINFPDITYQPDGGGGLNPRPWNFTDGAAAWVAVEDANATPGALDVEDRVGDGGSTLDIYSNGVYVQTTVTWDGSTNLVIYANGVSQAPLFPIFGNPGSLAGNTIAERGDGLRKTKAAYYQFVTYNRVLSQAEVTQLVQAG